MKTIVEMYYGSTLYGLSTPESDLDIKGIFMPSVNDILLGKIPKSLSFNEKISEGDKNQAGDVDKEFYSFHNFINMACDGNTIALDMLHAPKNMLIQSSPLWDKIVENRSKFYSKRLKSYLGYARTQVNKYGLKGNRLKSALMVKDFLSNYIGQHIHWIWAILPVDKNVMFVNDSLGNIFYEVCGRKIQSTLTVDQALVIVDNIVNQYGERANQSLNGTDWKCVTHALRACLQLSELYRDGTITFPLKDRALLMKVKTGRMDFTTEISPMLDSLLNHVEELCANSDYPEKVDREFWDNFIIDEVRKIL